MSAADGEALVIPALDGYPIAATRYPAAGRERGQVVMAGATAVPQAFYGRFARWLAERGLTVLTLDYRGVGRSRPAALRGFRADLRDWAERDLPAVVDAALREGPTSLVGHSFGAQAFGVLPQANRLLGLYSLGSGSGWSGHMPPRERARVLLFWHAVTPALTRAFGYLPSRRVGLGEDLPLGVYRQWKRWCSLPRYFLDDDGLDYRARYAAVRAPAVISNALDDLWASPRAARALYTGLTGAPVRFEVIDPAARGLGAIGHLGYFRPRAAPLWPDALRFLDERLAAAAAG